MSKTREYPAERAGFLLAIGATITTSDIVGITPDPRYQRNLVTQEVMPVGDGIIINVYRFDERDLKNGFPINQDALKITLVGSVATLAQLDNKDSGEHWLPKLPERVCKQSGCDLCSKFTLTVSGKPVACCLEPWIPGVAKVPKIA